MGYIQEMRKLVGHRTLIQCAASVFCIDNKGRILLGLRSDNHLWSQAGGAVEIDEIVEFCARRELEEETGLIADQIEFFCVNSGPQTHYIYPNGDEVSNMEIVYLCREYHGTLKAADGEMLELRFFRPDEIDLNIISPPDRGVMKKLIDELSGNEQK